MYISKSTEAIAKMISAELEGENIATGKLKEVLSTLTPEFREQLFHPRDLQLEGVPKNL